MQIREIAYAAFVGVAAVAFVIGSAVPSEAAKKKKWGFLMGQVMRELKGQGNAQVINRILEQRLAGD